LSLSTDFDLKERVRAAVDIVDVVGATTELRPQGRNFVARCPWHNDRRPSMTVNQELQTWKCWPCDIGGDVFSFVMRRDGVDFPTAIRSLAEQAGIAVPELTGGRRTEPGSPDDRPTLFSAMELITKAYFDQLESGTSDDARLAREYLAERGISEESRRRYQIGFAPDSWDFAVNLLKEKGFSGEVAHAAGIASAKRSGDGFVDMFRGRLMFPILDLQRRPVALGGRIIPEIAKRLGERAGGKYINGRETILFRKSHQLYGLDQAREAIRKGGEAIVMEGYTDVVMTRQEGIEPVVAVLGTALGEQHVKILKRLAQRVVLVLDGDEAGQNRADEVLELFVHADVDLRVLTLPEGQDPADYVAQHGRESLERLANDAPDALDHKLARLTEGVNLLEDTHAVTQAVDTMLKIVAQAPDGLKTDQLLMRMASRFNFKPERLELRLKSLREESQRRERFRSNASANANRSTSGTTTSSRKPTPTSHHISSNRSDDPNAALQQSADFEEAFDELLPETSRFVNPRQDVSLRQQERLRSLASLERDLFETLIESPELAMTAVEVIDPEWFETNTAKMLLSAYQDLEFDGHPLDIDSLLLLVENEQLKNQLVTLQERIQNRSTALPQTIQQRYNAVINRFRELAFSHEQTKKIEQLASELLPEDEEVAILEAMIAEARSKHGIQPPTDK
jgi:DNA primase